MDEIRKKIDLCDREITKLLEERFSYVEEVGRYKLENNINIFDSTREVVVLDRISENIKDSTLIPYIRDIYTGIMDSSKSYQANLKRRDVGTSQNQQPETIVAYQGVPGSYGEEAMLGFFRRVGVENVQGINYKSFEQVAETVISGKVKFGVLPVENSFTGTVTASMDLLVRDGLYIIGEYILPVCHNLMAKKGTKLEDIVEVYSHEQGFMQCTEFFAEHPEWIQTEYTNTAAAAKLVAESEGFEKAAVASSRAAEIYGLDIIVSNINGSRTNSTRFLILSNDFNSSGQWQQNVPADKISVIFSLPHKSGSLFEALKIISQHGLNLLKIESRPSGRVNWEYMFFMDFEGELGEEQCRYAIDDLSAMAGALKVLGNYKKDDKEI